jgi:tRNA(Ile)-lysidine synthase
VSLLVPPELLARCRFPPAATALRCGVSGGADSLALLALAAAAGCRATAVHVDHGLRPGSAAEADAVEAAARRLGTGFEGLKVVVPPGPDLEARARAARLAALGADAALGHTADDRAETMLLNLLRGAGLDGLSVLAPSARHPIAGLRRAETRALCAGIGLLSFDDPSNVDPRFLRNRVRHEVLPLLDDVAGRDVAGLLARTAGHLADDAAVLATLAADVDPGQAGTLAAAPGPLARRAVRRWLAEGGPGGPEHHPPDTATVERVLAVARGGAVATDVGDGWEVRRSGGRLTLRPVAPRSRSARSTER